MSDEIAEQIEQDVRKLEEHSVVTGGIRKKIVDKLAGVVETMVIDPNNDKSTAIEAKMNIMNTLLKALSDSDSQKIDLIKMKQKIKATDEKEDSIKMVAQTVAAFMQKLDTRVNIAISSNPTSPEVTASHDEGLDAAVISNNLEVLEGELEMTTKSAKDIEK